MKELRVPILAAALALCPGAIVLAQTKVPDGMNYQGLLTDNSGNPVAPATPENRVIQFRLYTQAVGGTPVWGEQQTVTVFKGNFSVILGNGLALGGVPSGQATFATRFTTASNGSDFFLGITQQGAAEFSPRQKLISAPFSFRSKLAEVAESVSQSSGSSTLNTAVINNLTIAGPTKINAANTLEFGAGVVGKEASAGKIGYGVFTPNTLDIVGAGTASANPLERKIKFWNEGGATFTGPLTVGGSVTATSFSGNGVNLTNVAKLTANFFTGNQTINTTSKLVFQSAGRECIDFFGGTHTMGVQSLTTYFRSPSNYAFFAGGSHAANQNDPGTGGRLLASLDDFGLTVGDAGTAEGIFVKSTGPASPASASAICFRLLDSAGGSLSALGYAVQNGQYVMGSINRDTALQFLQNGRLVVGSPTEWSAVFQTSTAGGTTTGNTIKLAVNGAATATSFFNLSDERLKEDIKPLKGALNTLGKLEGVTYSWKDTATGGKGQQLGFVAQDVRDVLPELVAEGHDGTLSVNYNGLIPVLVESVKEQQEQIEALREERDSTRLELKALEDRLKAIETRLAPASSGN